MKNVKLFLKSLFSNNAAIDGARKKPWYAAIIIFFLSIVLSVIPSTVIELKKHGDKYFETTTYNTQEAVTEFAQYVNTLDKDVFYVKTNKEGNKYLVADETVRFERYNKKTRQVDFVFQYAQNKNVDKYMASYTNSKTGKGVSYFLFTPDTLYIRVLDPNDYKTEKVKLQCINAYKKVEENQIKKSYVKVMSGSKLDLTKTCKKTWENWKILIKNFFNQTRLRAAGLQLGIISAVNAGISLIMGFMVWVLTRGKNNPYRLFSVWDSFKISFWSGSTPAILTIALGFLISRFASTLFPLFLGVRVMWLTLKSLRPDGSGYAAN